MSGFFFVDILGLQDILNQISGGAERSLFLHRTHLPPRKKVLAAESTECVEKKTKSVAKKPGGKKMGKKTNLKIWWVISVLLASVLSGSVWATGTYDSGDGSEGNPFQINTPAQMDEIGQHSEDWDNHFLLVNDIDLISFTGSSFNIIGTPTVQFNGVFDGNDHSISNFTYESSGTESTYIALFGQVSGQIKNLTLIDPNISGGSRGTGAVVGWLDGGSIINCHVRGGSISGNYDAGGLAWGSDGTVTNSSSTASVHGGDSVGGLLGALDSSGTVSNCYSSGDVSGDEYVGGLVGYGANYATVSKCYSTGNVSGNLLVGGFIGINDAIYIYDSYSTGNVSGNRAVGGFVGDNGGLISNCYSTGTVEGTTFVEGFGGDPGGGVLDSFWDVNSSGQTTSEGGTGKTTAQMQTKSTFTDAGWDFSTPIWEICEGTNYPKLTWQIPLGDFICPDGVTMFDFSILAAAWFSSPSDSHWNPICDISDPNDNLIDELDLDVFTDNWLVGVE